jgi:hypothetical protein
MKKQIPSSKLIKIEVEMVTTQVEGFTVHGSQLFALRTHTARQKQAT